MDELDVSVTINPHADRIHHRRIPILLLQQRPTPIHVHVKRGSGEAVFVVEGDVVLRESVGMKTSELARAEDLAIEHKELIIQKWHEFFD